MRLYLSACVVVVAVVGSVVAAQGPARGARAGGPAVDLPDGPGKEQVQATCGTCHALTNITNSRGNDAQGWDKLTSSMILLPAELKTPIISYLGSHFPRKPGGNPVIVPGSVRVNIREWVVPSLGSRPHDPLAAADGSIWWTGQWASVLGRLDPKTGAMKEFPLKTPQTGPHGLAEDTAGNVWY